MNLAGLRSFGEPDAVRECPKGRLELIKIGGATGAVAALRQDQEV